MAFVTRKQNQTLHLNEYDELHSTECEYLLVQIYDPDPRVRRLAIRDLAMHSSSVPVLCDFIQQEEELSVQEAIFSTLLEIGNEEVVTNLIPLLKSDDASIRNSVVELMQQLPMIVIPFIEDLLNDSDSDIRILTLNILRDLIHPKTHVWLLKVIQKEENVNVVGTAVDCLAEIGKPNMIPELQALKNRFEDEPYITFAVDTAIHRIKENE